MGVRLVACSLRSPLWRLRLTRVVSLERVRVRAVGGMVGPVAFVGAWSLAGISTRHYSATGDAISKLAETGASTRLLMTAGFVAFGIGVPVYAGALRNALAGPAWATAVATGLATLGVAAVPLGSPRRDTVHGYLATAGYVTLAATPLLAARPLARAGRTAWARASVLSGVASAACLVATIPGPAHGLFQRLGLGAVDVWIVASAVEILRRGRLSRPLTFSSSSVP
jgi:Protein of unknown function (DUF998)